MKIMFYSQHVLGIGHFFRSMALAQALNRHQVLFVEGGDPLPGFVAPDHIRRLFLPPLMMDSEFKAMVTQEALDPEEIKPRRKRLLMEAFEDFAPDVLITELFPFGRKQFRFELMPLLEAARKKPVRTRVVCSLRDILVEKANPDTYEEGVLHTLHSHYDLLLVHSDPRLIPLKETFQTVDKLRIPLVYTGFVVRKPPPRPITNQDHRSTKVIVVSSGGGKVGVDLLEATLRAVRDCSREELRLRAFIGPFMDPSDRARLEDIARGDPRMDLCPFSLDFLSELAKADLSVSMAGYNTCMDILSAGIKSLVYPFPQNREQALRAGKLEEAGHLKVLCDLDQETLSAAILGGLDTPPPAPRMHLDLTGAETTALLVEKHCKIQ